MSKEDKKRSEAEDKYKTKITLQNDSVLVDGGASAYYSPSQNAIFLKKAKISLEKSPEKSENLEIIHERQHQINSKYYKNIVSLNEAYNRNVHDEITALIAEHLEIRNQYKACKTPEEQRACLEEFAKTNNFESYRPYIEAIKCGQINPNSTSDKDFIAEMAFIKDNAIQYRADPADSGYGKQWMAVASENLSENGKNARPNPQGFAEDVKAMYHIGGFDFNTVGNQELMLMNNQSVVAADNMLAQNADPQKILKFMQKEEGPYVIAEQLDITGLSKEQAEKVILTAIANQERASIISEDVCLGKKPEIELGSYNQERLRKQVAPYMVLKAEIWEKNNMLTDKGDEKKFEQLMEQAQMVQLDPEKWFRLFIEPAKYMDRFEKKRIKARVDEYQGKIVNINDVAIVTDKDALPYDKVSLAETLEEEARKAKEDAKFWEEYYKKHPINEEEPIIKSRISEKYEVEITDFDSDILKNELETRQEKENRPKAPQEKENEIEPLHKEQEVKTYAPLGDGQMIEIKNPKFQNAELSHLEASDGSTIDVAYVDGKKHGAEITRDAMGNITDIKAYENGKEIDLTKCNLEYHNEEKDGSICEYVTLNGNPFGAVTAKDKEGKTKVAFYNHIGQEIVGEEKSTIKKSKGEFTPDKADNRTELKETLYAQKEEADMRTDTEDSPRARSQAMRFDFRTQLHRPTSPATPEPAKEDTSEKINLTPFILPDKSSQR